MKKLMTILVVFAICGAAMAAETVDPNAPISLKKKTEQQTVYKTKEGYWSAYVSGDERNYMTGETREKTSIFGIKYTEYYVAEHQVANGTKTVNVAQPYLNIKEDGTLGNSGLTYTITDSTDYNRGNPYNGYVRQTAKGYFTVTEDVPAGKVVAVQFLGAEMEDGSGNQTHNANNKIVDYGIYLYDTATEKRIGDYLSVKDFNNYFGEDSGIKAGTSFGVFYKDQDGNYIASTGDGGKYRANGTFKAEENGILGNFDINNHELSIYDSEGNVSHPTTDKHFLCLSSGEYGRDSFQNVHWEFMLQTTIDDPYYPVNPNDFFEGGGDVHVDDPIVNGDVASGQPLPGTLATILISGLCAGALRKRNKK